MLIQCTSCGAQAKLPDSKEGAKVRCASCGHVYVARRPGAKGATKKEDPTKYFIIGGAAIAVVVVLTLVSGGDPPPPPKKEEVAEKLAPPVVVDELGWDSPAAKLTRDMHLAALAQNRPKLTEALDGAAAHADWRQRQLDANAEDIAEAEAYNAKLGEGVEPVAVPEALVLPTWDELALEARNVFVSDRIDEMLVRDPENLLTAWQPFSGSVLALEDDTAVVRLQVNRIEGDQTETRTIEWRLVDRRSAGAENPIWRVAGWNRFLSPAELAAARRGRTKKTSKRTLSDGSLVIESEIRAIAYDADVPQQERDRLDALVRQRMDLDARPKVRTEANQALAAAGKPAIAPLLTAIANELPVITGDNPEAASLGLMRLGLVHQTLTEMTGYVTTFKPDESLGATKERIESGLKQWFGWYDRRYKKYTGRPQAGDDPMLDDPSWQPRDEREKRDFEEARRAQQGG